MGRRKFIKLFGATGVLTGISGCLSPSAEATFDYQPSNPTPGEPIVFDAGESTGDVYTWEFVDSEEDEINRQGEQVSIRTDGPGVIIATLTAASAIPFVPTGTCRIDGFGCSVNETTKRVYVQSDSAGSNQNQLQIETEQVNISLTGDKTGISVNDTALLQFSASNLIGNSDLTIQLIIETPSGISVTSSAFIESGGGQYTSTFVLSPGESKGTRIQIDPTAAGRYTITGHAVYYFGDDTNDRQSRSVDIPITVTS